MNHAMIRRFEWILVVALCAAVGWFHVWTARSSGDRWKFGSEQKDYYNLLIDGYLDGQLNMKVEVPEALLRLKDPYDPSVRPPGLGLHDASFYKGKYYVYFGVAPVVSLMLPFRLITGADLPQSVATLVFVFSGFLASVAIWLSVRRRYFPKTGTLVALSFVPVLGLAGLGPVLLRRPHVWELPIGAGYCFAMLTLYCVWRSLHAERGGGGVSPAKARAAWLAGAGLFLGLAIASRPTYLVAGPLLAVPLWWWWRAERRFPWRAALSAAVPLAVIGGAMAWHNYARFDDPLQFGQAYQFSLDYESKMAHFRAGHVPFNVWRYFFSAAQWSPYFPFISPAELPPKPAGFGGHDDVYGVVRNMPIAWLVLALPLALWRRDKPERGALGAWLATAAVLFVAMAGILVCFFGSLARYQSDFTPTLILLAGVGALAVERWLGATCGTGLRGLARTLWLAAAGVSAGFALLFSLQLDGLFGERNPRQAREVAETLNQIPAWWERMRGVRHGAAELTVRLRSEATGQHDLLTIGDPPQVDRVFVRHLDPERVILGFAHGGAPDVLSRPMQLDFGRDHALRVTLGSLFPPATHPWFKGLTADEVDLLARQVRIELDGETVIDERRRFERGTGKLRAGGGAAVAVSGLRRVEAGAAGRAEKVAAGFVRLRLSFPERPPTPREPLLAVGDAASGTVIFVHYVDDTGQIAFGSSFRGERSGAGDAAFVDLTRAHELVARWSATGDGARRRLELRLDGTIMFSRDVSWPERDGALVAGRNVHDEPGCAPLFTGKLHNVQRSADGRDPLEGPGDTLKLRVLLPQGRAGASEPLVVTGRHGGGDLLMIEYVDVQTVRFALDHWGSATLRSEPVRIDPARPHDFEISLTSLVPPVSITSTPHIGKGRVSVGVDGTRVWEAETVLFTIPAGEFAIGRNPIGGTAGGPRFTGDVLVAERVVRD
ncbi:MAG: hypothetical protein EXS37_21620 [Opitutus sp.]|nr:hypothetical protein [Opitutus sp.]